MHISTKLPFPHLWFKHWDRAGRNVGVLVVKGSFHIDEGVRSQRFLEQQPDLLTTDLHQGEPNLSPVRQESDLAPFKPRTDLTFEAVARSPEAKELERWPVKIDVAGRLSYGFDVFGARLWEPTRAATGRKWVLSSTKPVSAVPLTYAFAFGGTVPTGEDDAVETHDQNPLGRGLLNDHLLSRDEAIPVPQIGLLGELGAPRPDKQLTVCGLGPIAKSWLPRLSLAGTFDDAWLRERHPRMPDDFDDAYWNGAPLPLQAAPYLRGDEAITLTGVRHDARPYSFLLPGALLSCRVTRGGTEDVQDIGLNLDTVHCKMAGDEAGDQSLSMVWRVVLPDPDTIEAVELAAHRLEEAPS